MNKQNWTHKPGYRILLALMLVFLLTLPVACSRQPENEPTQPPAGSTTTQPEESETQPEQTTPAPAAEIFVFSYQGQDLAPKAKAAPILEALGESLSYFEAESCAFEGLDKIFTYSSFEISTVPIDGEDHISLIVLLDDTVATDQGIRIGSSREAVLAAYGTEYEVQGQAITYTREDTRLMFIFEDDQVVTIEYIADYGI